MQAKLGSDGRIENPKVSERVCARKIHTVCINQ